MVTAKAYWRGLLISLAQTAGFLKASITITRTHFAALVFFQLGPFRKLLLKKIQPSVSGQMGLNELNLFLDDIVNSLNYASHLRWNLSLEGSGILTRFLDFEKSPETPLENALLWEMKKNVPIPLSQAHFAYRLLRKSGNRFHVLVSVLRKDFLDKFLSTLEGHSFQIGSVGVLSLQMAGGIKASSYTMIGEHPDFIFRAEVEKRKIVSLEVEHVPAGDPRRNRLASSASQKKVYVLKESDSHEWNLPSSLPVPSPVGGNLDRGITFGLWSSALGMGFSPELLPKPYAEQIQKQVLWQRVALVFLVFQILTPFFYLKLESQKRWLYRNTQYVSLNAKIAEARKKWDMIQKESQEIILLNKAIRPSKFLPSVKLKQIALRVNENMAMTRIRISPKKGTLDGYALNLEAVSRFMEELESAFGKGNLSLKTERKGDAISFRIGWREGGSRR